MRLEIEDGELSEIVLAAITRAAERMDYNLEYHNRNSYKTNPKDIAEWQAMSDKLWQLVRQFPKSSRD